MDKKQPNPIDVHVGGRVRLRRQTVGMSQEKLGEALGITFQQIQKYENGMNRISVSRLSHIAGVLSTPVAWFFEDAPGTTTASTDPESSRLFDILATADGRRLSLAFSRIRNPHMRRKVAELVSIVADAAEETPERESGGNVSVGSNVGETVNLGRDHPPVSRAAKPVPWRQWGKAAAEARVTG